MNTLLALGAMVGAVIPKAPVPEVIDSERLLAAIAMVETGNDNSKLGKWGERSAWQFGKPTWRQYTTEPFHRASTDRLLSKRIADRHYQYLSTWLQRRKIAVTVRTLAAAWRYGEKWALLLQDSDYAERVENLYKSTE